MISKYFKELERENILKNEEKKVKKFKMNRRKNIKKNKRRNTTSKNQKKKNTLKRTEKFFKNLGEYLNTVKKYLDCDNDDPDYKRLRKIENLFSEVETLMGNETDDIMNELFESFKQTYQNGLEKKWGKGSLFLKALIYCIIVLIKQVLRRGKSYIKSLEWLRNKRATIHPENKKDDKCFKYAVTSALNHQNIERGHQRTQEIRPFVNIWKGIKFPSHQEDWKKFEQNNKSIALNILFVPHYTKTIRLAYKSKYNCKRENQVVLAMITDGEKWHYLAVKSLSSLLRGIT